MEISESYSDSVIQVRFFRMYPSMSPWDDWSENKTKFFGRALNCTESTYVVGQNCTSFLLCVSCKEKPYCWTRTSRCGLTLERQQNPPRECFVYYFPWFGPNFSFHVMLLFSLYVYEIIHLWIQVNLTKFSERFISHPICSSSWTLAIGPAPR